MKVLITGHDGYIGAVLTPMLQLAGHEVIGLDTYLYEGCGLGPEPSQIKAYRLDVRDVVPEVLRGFDAVVHLATISSDSVGDLNPTCTYELNHKGSVVLARTAKAAGVRRFLFASSCNLYDPTRRHLLDEGADLRPSTPYGESMILAEKGISGLADDDFSPTILRTATAYGFSPRLRGDLGVNNAVASAVLTGEALVQSGGGLWRSFVHVEDIARAFTAVLHAPRALVHDEAFNVGRTDESHEIRRVAKTIEEVVVGSRVTVVDTGAPDARLYRVNCDKLARTLPWYRPIWTVRTGSEQLLNAFRRHGLRAEQLHGPDLQRLNRIHALIREGRLDDMFRWTRKPAAAGESR